MTRYFARVTRGIEWVAAAEIAVVGRSEILEIGHREVHFSTDVAPSALLALRTVDDVFVHVDVLRGIGRQRASLAVLRTMATGRIAGAIAAVASTRTVRPSDSFVVTGSALGKRNFNRYEIEDAVGAAIGAALGATYISRTEHPRPPETPLAWRVHLHDDVAIIGIRLAATALHRRSYKQDTTLGTLHPPVAAALALIGGIVAGETIADPFCGSGTIVTEYACIAGAGLAAGSDLSQAAVAAAAANAAAAGAASGVVVLRADATELPFVDGSVDVVATNPPWDRRVALAGAGHGDVGAPWREISRVVRPSGRIVVLSEQEIVAPPGFARHDLGMVAVSGSRPRLQVLVGPSGSPSPMPPVGSRYADELRRYRQESVGSG